MPSNKAASVRTCTQLAGARNTPRNVSKAILCATRTTVRHPLVHVTPTRNHNSSSYLDGTTQTAAERIQERSTRRRATSRQIDAPL